MATEPEVITTIAKKLTFFNEIMPGYGFWYGELGKDTEFAKLILDNKSLQELKDYVIEKYGDDPEHI
jgi:uncharacterized membrane protein YukC